jgi:hypothetical protein
LPDNVVGESDLEVGCELIKEGISDGFPIVGVSEGVILTVVGVSDGRDVLEGVGLIVAVVTAVGISDVVIEG